MADDEIKIKYIDPVVAGEVMFNWAVVTQPHHTRPPDAAQIAQDGYVETRRIMTIAEMKKLFPESSAP